MAWYVSVYTLNDWITLPRISSWGNAAQFLPKSMLHSHSKSMHFKCVLNIHKEVSLFFFLKKPWRLLKGGNTFLIQMKHVLRGTHWIACANFLHPVLKCVCWLKSFYESSMHLEASLVWLQVINTILGSTWAGMEGKSEYSNRSCRNCTDLKSNMELLLPCAGELIDTTWLRVSFDHLSARLPPVLNKAGNQIFPSRAQAWLYTQCIWICRGIGLVITIMPCPLLFQQELLGELKSWWLCDTTSVTQAEIYRFSAPARPWHAN